MSPKTFAVVAVSTLIAVIAAIVWVVSRSARTGGANEDSPETILKRRYARGEIDRQEYEQRLADLRK